MWHTISLIDCADGTGRAGACAAVAPSRMRAIGSLCQGSPSIGRVSSSIKRADSEFMLHSPERRPPQAPPMRSPRCQVSIEKPHHPALVLFQHRPEELRMTDRRLEPELLGIA